MPETIGQQLKRVREERTLTVKKVSQTTHIQARFIEAIEADAFDSLPSPVQARAFLRLYAEFLGVSLDDLISKQRLNVNELSPFTSSQVPDDQSQAHLDDHKDLTVEVPNDVIQKKEVFQNPIDDAGESANPKNSSGETRKSQEIFAGIGEALRQRREAISLTLDEIEHHTHIRLHYLQALEAGDFEYLPSSVQTRGMLTNYAHFLDMDVEAILLRFADGLQAQRLERQPQLVQNRQVGDKSFSVSAPSPAIRRFLSMDVVVGVGLILILLLFAIWGTTRVVGLRAAASPEPSAQSISDILAASPSAGTPTAPAISTLATEAVLPGVGSTAIVTVPVSGQGPVQVVLVALEQAFVRVTVDGNVLFNGRAVAGTAYPFDGNTQIEILTGNGAAVSILFNNSDMGPMGNIGEVVDRIYTANAILKPTATFTPSPTITPTPTITPRFSPTPTSTSTPQNTLATGGEG